MSEVCGQAVMMRMRKLNRRRAGDERLAEMPDFKAKLKTHLDKPIGNGYMSLIVYDRQGTERDKEASRLDAKTTGRGRGHCAERTRNAGTGRDWHKRAGLSLSLAGCRGGGH